MTEERSKNILITGGAGYIGSTLAEMLLERGYKVTILDRLFFGDTIADLRSNPRLHVIKNDIRWADKQIMQDVDAVCDLASISNDPSGELDPQKTIQINHEGRARICRLAKSAGVKRYILASSCSIYGFQDNIVDENDPVNPLTTYALANRQAEESVLKESSDNFIVTTLRQATVYGLSRRMRFDLAINGMTLSLFKQGSVKIMRDGTQWRPMIHVKDTSRAFIAVLEADPALINGEIFNVGSDDQNLQIRPLAERLSGAVGIPYVEDWYGDPDRRSYRVSFKKIKERLNYKNLFTPEQGAKEIFAALKNGALKDEPITRTVEWYKSLIYWDDIISKIKLNDNLI